MSHDIPEPYELDMHEGVHLAVRLGMARVAMGLLGWSEHWNERINRRRKCFCREPVHWALRGTSNRSHFRCLSQTRNEMRAQGKPSEVLVLLKSCKQPFYPVARKATNGTPLVRPEGSISESLTCSTCSPQA
jgi:hypothetical protein